MQGVYLFFYSEMEKWGTMMMKIRVQLNVISCLFVFTATQIRGGLGGAWGTVPPPLGILGRKETNCTILLLFIVNKKPDLLDCNNKIIHHI